MVAPSRNHLNLGIVQVLANASPRNHLDLRSARPSGGPFAFERNRKNSSQITSHVDPKLAFCRRQDDLLHQRANQVGRRHPLFLRILLKRRIQLIHLGVVVMRHVWMQEGRRLLGVLQERF
ncbi:hypothetical protein [Xanthobacter versatilis]|uniref:hypothetical protein n=1 Tax=Xanthobacter autotrophicus (strain ATCC BAA-1158 / Py2) TaxID=78245 RepID=UPI003726EFE5